MRTLYLAKFTKSLTIFLAFIFLLASLPKAQGLDLPNPPTNLELISAGSLVIGMDNTTQSIIPPFNLKAYGLVNALLQNDIPVKWAIRSGKAKDGVDFSAQVSQVLPVAIPSVPLDFKSGPFIIENTFAALAMPIIIAFGQQVAVFSMDNDEMIDVRYTLDHKPNIALFDNGGNAKIHAETLDEALITNYTVMMAGAIVDSTSCFTYCSEPHWKSDDEKDTTETIAVMDFVMSGGNFFGQCAGLETYSHFNKFQTTKGIEILNESFVQNVYHNADMAMNQFEGEMVLNEGGSVRNWRADATKGSLFKGTTYKSISDIYQDTVCVTGAKIVDPNNVGGNTFYMGGHDYFDTDDIENINALRIYLNTIFIPAVRPETCFVSLSPLAVEFLDISASSISQESNQLIWKTASEWNTDYFEIERSLNSKDYSVVGSVSAAGNSNQELKYSFIDNISGLESDRFFYRLKQIDKDGQHAYSKMVMVAVREREEGLLAAYPVPLMPGGEFYLEYHLDNEELLTIKILDAVGQLVYVTAYNGHAGTNKSVVQTTGFAKGTYLVKIGTKSEMKSIKMVLN